MGLCSQYGEDCKLTCGKCAERSSSFISNSVELGRNCTGAEIKSLNCEQRCRVTNDIAECACHGGFKADGRRCVDQNECADSSLRDSCEELNLKCHNYEGGYFCGDAQSCGFSEMRRFRQAGCCKTDSSEMCGKQSIIQRGRIYGGEDASRKQWPWMVWIKYRDFEGRDRLCGGSLISSEWVLTAAHCLLTVKDKFETCDGCLEMNMGVHDTSLGYFDEIHRTRLQAKKIVIHEKFVAQGLFNDIALIQIAPTDIETSDYVKPVCLPNYEEPVAGTKCFIAGWGKTLETTSSDVLKDTEITISDVDECTANYAAKPEFEI